MNRAGSSVKSCVRRSPQFPFVHGPCDPSLRAPGLIGDPLFPCLSSFMLAVFAYGTLRNLNLLCTLLTVCYTTGMALKAALGNSVGLPGPSPKEGMVIDIADLLGPEHAWIRKETAFSDTYLAGAGAIGNGFLYGLSHFHPVGSLTIVDPDTVSDGNMNRCVLFQDEDLGFPKAVRLAKNAQPMLPNCELLSAEATIQQLGKNKEGNWLHRLIVAVDVA